MDQYQPPAPGYSGPPIPTSTPPKKSRRNLIIGVVVAVVVLLLVAAALSRPGGTPGPTGAATPKAPAAAAQGTASPTDALPPAPTPEATEAPTVGPPADFGVGDAVTLEEQIHTVVEADWWTSDNQFIEPDAGNAFQTWLVAIEGTDPAGTSYNPFYYRLRGPDGFEYTITIGRDPDLGSSNDLAAGARVQGWLTFEVPATAGTYELHYTPGLFGESVMIRAALDEPD